MSDVGPFVEEDSAEAFDFVVGLGSRGRVFFNCGAAGCSGMP